MGSNPTVFLLILLSAALFADGQRKKSLPIREIFQPLIISRSKIAGCHFGGDFFELEQEWNPNLGSPFGVLACVQCKCVAVQRKRKMVGTVTCKNFGSLCPKAYCKNATVKPGECCYTCPGQAKPVIKVFGDNELAKGDYNWGPGYTEYFALLTGRFTESLTAGAGRAYITVYEDNLHYSVHYESLEEIPKTVQFVDTKGVILMEHSVANQQRRNKICGVWESVPKVYAKYLKKGDLSIIVTTRKKPDGILGGTIVKPKGLVKEILSSLLLPTSTHGAKNLGYGGAAIIDVSNSGDILNISIVFNASLNAVKSGHETVLINLEKHDGGRRRQSKVVETPIQYTNGLMMVEATIPLGQQEQRWLARGKLLITLSSEVTTPSEFVGSVTPKQSCDGYQAILTSTSPADNGAAGVAMIEVTDDGAFKYRLRLQGLYDSDLSGFRIERDGQKRKKKPVAEAGGDGFRVESGVAAGHFNREMSSRDVELLSQGKLTLELFSRQGDRLLKGHLRRLLYSNAVHTNTLPAVLSGSEVSDVGKNTTAAGVAWLSETEDDSNGCELAFSLFITGLPPSLFKPKDVKISICLLHSRDCVYQFSSYKTVDKDLMEFSVFGSASDVPHSLWKTLNSAGTFLKISVPGYEDGLIAGNISVPNRCWDKGVQMDRLVSEDSQQVKVVRTDCDYKGQMYKDGESWNAQHLNCSLCNCQRGSIKCDAMVCPVIDCSNKVLKPGDCCPSCPTPETSSPGCYLAGRFHAAGSTWHPYLPPNGFNKCVLCQCQAQSSIVTCTRQMCPLLGCPLKDQEVVSGECCKRCKEPIPTTPTPFNSFKAMGDEQSGKCYHNREWHLDGTIWVPKLAVVGSAQCISCSCTNGTPKCKRPSCTSLSCSDPQRFNGCCPKCQSSKSTKTGAKMWKA